MKDAPFECLMTSIFHYFLSLLVPGLIKLRHPDSALIFLNQSLH